MYLFLTRNILIGIPLILLCYPPAVALHGANQMTLVIYER